MQRLPSVFGRHCASTVLATCHASVMPFASAALTASARHNGGIRPPENNYVSTAADQTDEEKMIANAVFVDVDADMVRKLQAAAAAAAGSHAHAPTSASSDDNVAGAAPSLQQLDDSHFDVNAGVLPPTRRVRPESALSMEERRLLSEMLYNTHYKSEVRNGSEGVKAMIYQSALELKFLEEAIESEIAERGDHPRDANVVRQRIKRAVLERCDLHKPLSYIIGYQPFYGCHINCAQPLLCPRPETEMWCHWLVNNFLEDATEPFHVLDMCSGTGCVGVSIAKNAPQAHVVGVDILPEAVSMSNINATRNGIPNERYQCIESDMFSVLDQRASDAAADAAPSSSSVCVPYGSVDLIVSNPPYILPNQYDELPKTITHWESRVALVGDAFRQDRQYTYFQDLCEKGAKFLKPAGSRQEALRHAPSIIIEIGMQGEKVASIMEKHPDWIDVELHTDFAGQPRWVSARRR
jgi:HemK-like putative methylase